MWFMLKYLQIGLWQTITITGLSLNRETLRMLSYSSQIIHNAQKNQQIISFSGTSTHTYLKCLTAFSPRSSKPVQTHVTLFFILLFLLVFRALKKMKLKIQCSKNSKCRLTSCTSLAMFILRMKLHVIILHNWELQPNRHLQIFE